MARGRQTRELTKEQAQRLEKFRLARHEGAECGYSLPQLARAMAAPFGYKTLGKALQGLPVWDLHHTYIVSWLDRFVPAGQDVVDYDDLSGHHAASEEFRQNQYSGRREQPVEQPDAEETPGAARTVRGSR
jgi:hypothetical protein